LRWLVRNQSDVQRAVRRFLRDRNPEFGPLQKVTIVTDKAREIYVAHWPDRVVLMAVGQVLADLVDPLLHDDLYSFRKGRGPIHALEAATAFLRRMRAAGHERVYALKRDVTKYGDSIPQAQLLARLDAELDLPSQPLMRTLVRQAIRPQVLSVAGDYSLCLGIPSGSPLVPPLENFYLLPLDERIRKLPDVFYGRYGDDFLVLTPSSERAREAAQLIDEEVKRLGLAIKPEKKVDHELCSARGGLTWLGRRLNWPGALGPKPEHFELVRRRLRSEVFSLVHRSRELPVALRPRMVKAGIRELLDLRVEARLADIVWRGDMPSLVAQLQKDLMRWLVGAVTKSYRVRKAAAWRFVKKLPVPSLERRRHVYLLRKNKRQEGGTDAVTNLAA
jgi:hypothetical protein